MRLNNLSKITQIIGRIGPRIIDGKRCCFCPIFKAPAAETHVWPGLLPHGQKGQDLGKYLQWEFFKGILPSAGRSRRQRSSHGSSVGIDRSQSSQGPRVPWGPCWCSDIDGQAIWSEPWGLVLFCVMTSPPAMGPPPCFPGLSIQFLKRNQIMQ